MSKILLRTENLKKYFPMSEAFLRPSGWIKAVDEVSLDVHEGETLGVVGESGCGKTTLGKIILRLHDLTAGKVYFDGKDVFSIPTREIPSLRRGMQMVYQDPYSSLNPRMNILDNVGRSLKIHGIATGKKRDEMVAKVLKKVGLDREHMRRYPHELSGGQRQRVAIARALATSPKFILLDEPTSSLDVSVQSQVLNLLQDLQEELGLTYLFITHNLTVVQHISTRMAIMYLGRIVEVAETHNIFEHPEHPYTRALLSAIPVPDPERTTKRSVLQGGVPSPANPPPGCRFHTRCPHAVEQCSTENPELKQIRPGQFVACHLAPID